MAKLIIIEGTDASGKQTQSKLLQEYLKAKRISFPDYDSKGAWPVKMFLNGELGEISNITSYASSALYAVDRYTSFKSSWEKDYLEDGIIISDRYTISNMIHQGNRIKDENEFWSFCDWIIDLEWNKFKLPKPDLIIFLDVPYDFSNKLMSNRVNKMTGKSEKDILESDEKQKKRAYEVCKKLCKKYSFEVINCVKDNELRNIEDIQEELRNLIKEKL